MPDRNLITIKEAAKRLGISERTLHRYMKAGELETFIIDRSDTRRYFHKYLDAEQVALLSELRDDEA